MTWVRYYSKKLFGPYLPYVPPEKATKYMTVLRLTYFISAASLLALVLKAKQEAEQQQLESGRPVIKDHSEGKSKFVIEITFILLRPCLTSIVLPLQLIDKCVREITRSVSFTVTLPERV